MLEILKKMAYSKSKDEKNCCCFNAFQKMNLENLHTLRTDKMVINQPQRQTVLQILQNMAYAKSKDEYNLHFKVFKKINFFN